MKDNGFSRQYTLDAMLNLYMDEDACAKSFEEMRRPLCLLTRADVMN